MEIVCIHSYKGGAGKTTIALNLATQLASKKKKVLLIESDFKMPSFDGIFEAKPNHYFNDYFITEQNASLKDCIIPLKGYNNLYVIIANPNFNPEEKIHLWDKRYHAFHLKRLQASLIELKKESYDYVIFDTPPGLSYVAINNIALSNHGVIVVRPNSQAIKGTFRMIEQLYLKTKSPEQMNMYILFNQIPRVAAMSKELNEWGQKFLDLKITEAGRIPCSCQGTYDMAKGSHIFQSDHEINRYMTPLLSFLEKEINITIPDPTLEF
jgi:MinD-like ATPase involved in chromosome partitioning or flagellar assembly